MAEKEVAAGEAERKLDVSISTTAGFYPTEGFDAVPEKQAVQTELDKAKHHLKIKDVNGWIATVISESGKRQIDPARSYAENNLSGQIEIDWGPSEGGGGV